MDQFSYHCGVMDAFNEIVKAGVKQLALSHPFDRDSSASLIEFARRIAAEYGNRMWVEEELLITDLFPYSANHGKSVILFYRDQKVLKRYLLLKEQKQRLIEQGEYKGIQRQKIAVEFGRLLSYSEDRIQSYITENQEKESFGFDNRETL